MKITFFARADLPSHKEKAFDDFLLGKAEHKDGSIESSHKPEKQSRSIEKILGEAQDSYFRGFYLDALKRYARVLSADTNQISAWVGQVRILADIGRYDSAIYWADKACEFFNNETLLFFAKALALAHAGRIDDAKAIINVPVGKDESPMMWLLRGEVLIRVRIDFIQKIFTPYKGIGRLGAFFCFVKALSPDQQDTFINQRIGLAYMLANHHGRAFEHLTLSLSGANNNPLTLYGLAECCRMKRDYEGALYYVKNAIAGNPNLDCAFELLEWLHGPARRFFGLFKRKARKEIS
ncbi:MAG: tetratricopeptide repeat protein [bacterium]